MTFVLKLPGSQVIPLRWAADVILGEMLGIEFRVDEGPEGEVVLAMDGARLVMPSLFPRLEEEESKWRTHLPALPLPRLDVADILPEANMEEPLPILFGNAAMEFAEKEIRCGIDILGAAFFMLSRFEEVALSDRDAHGRFPATASLAWKDGFLYRPIVDEYVELLWAMMNRLWQGQTRKRREGQFRISCDVDHPFDPGAATAKALARSVAADVGKRFDAGTALRRVRNFIALKQGNVRFDPHYTFDWYMDACERHSRRAAFYFIADHSAGAIDGCYDLTDPLILELIRKVGDRGHEIGLHGSYNSFNDPRQIEKERKRLIAACEKAGVSAGCAGNRQHYLRWDAAQTPDHIAAAGFDYDTSGSFPDRPGFRYGTSQPFSMWSWLRRVPLKLRQRPLVLMEGSVLTPSYLNMGYGAEALELMRKLKKSALQYGGDFTLLWHNSHFGNAKDKEFFQDLIA